MTANHADPMSEPRDNEINYVEFPAADPATLTATKAFYHEVFGWTYQDWGDTYADTPSSGVGSGINADADHRPAHPLPVLYTSQLEATRDRVLAAGGTVTREIGVRMALGAQRGEVQAMMLRRGGRLIALGIAAGAALAWPFARLLESFLFETPTTDPLVYTGAIVVIAFAGLGAVWFPARRATRVDPIIALRAE